MASPVVYYVEDYLEVARVDHHPVRKDRITANTNNWDLGTDVVPEVSSDASRDVTGIVAPAAAAVKVLYNWGANSIVLKHQSASSTAANRMITPDGNDYTLSGGGFVPLFYDTVDSRWVVGTVIKRSGAKLNLASSTLGTLLLLNRHFWSLKHLGYATDGTTANAGRLYYRYGLVVPTASFAANSAATRESLPVLDGEDEVIQVKRGVLGVFLLPATSDLMVSVRPNEPINY